MIVLRRLDGAQCGSEAVFRLASIEIGSSSDADYSFRDDASRAASRDHARIAFRAGWYEVEDLGSRNGTTLNGAMLVAPTRLRDGDVLVFGPPGGPRVEVGFRYERTPPHGRFDPTILLLGVGMFVLLAFVVGVAWIFVGST